MRKRKFKKISYFIQVNIGNEVAKIWHKIEEVESFYNYCSKQNNLNILGLMAIPPNNSYTKKYFEHLNDLNKSLGLEQLSMGMSSDYHLAIKYNATFIRIGSLIFGSRF